MLPTAAVRATAGNLAAKWVIGAGLHLMMEMVVGLDAVTITIARPLVPKVQLAAKVTATIAAAAASCEQEDVNWTLL